MVRMVKELYCGNRVLDLSSVVVMGILNITPDSFSDGGQLYSGDGLNLTLGLDRARKMVSAGAKIIDVGGESTRPGATPVGLQEELDRVIPVVEAISRNLDVIISVDTSSPEVMLAAAQAGAGIINDVRALSLDGAMAAAIQTGLPVCLMHMQGAPKTMQDNPRYDNVLNGVKSYLSSRIDALAVAGMAREKIIIDPGFGFGKTPAHNLMLLKHLQALSELGCPILAGLSRKSLIGHVLDRDVNERLAGSISLALLAAQHGASVLRVHDVQETVDAIGLWQALEKI